MSTSDVFPDTTPETTSPAVTANGAPATPEDPDGVGVAPGTATATLPTEREHEQLAALVELESRLAASEAQSQEISAGFMAQVSALHEQIVHDRAAHANEWLETAARHQSAVIEAEDRVKRAILESPLYRIEYGAPGPITRLWVLASSAEGAIAKIAAEHPAAGVHHARRVDIQLRY